MIRAFFICFLLFFVYKNIKRSEVVSIQTIQIESSDLGTIDSLLNFMGKIGMENTVVVLAQSYLETGHFTSKIYRTNKNCFGIKYRKGSLYAKGEKLGHAYYDNELDSFYDYLDWQKRSLKGAKLTDRQYLNHLRDPWGYGRGYAEDPLYVDKLIDIINKINRVRTAARSANGL